TDLYFWYQEIPNVDPARFNSPEAYLEAIRYRPLDQTFSYITSREANEAFYSSSQFIGFGLSGQVIAGEYRIAQVFPDSPAFEAGLVRGSRITQINGRTVEALVASGEIGGAFGPAEVGVTADIVFLRDGAPIRARMVKRPVTIPTVSLSRVYEVGGRRVGYIFFRNFVEPSYEALDAAFTELRNRSVDELVLDLRYNGGGLVSVAQHLASLIGGVRTDGQVFAEFFHNDKNGFRNRVLRFEPKPLALKIDRVVVVTTRASASASELVINALLPFMPVVVIGDRTYGKPVGQYGLEYCDIVLAPVAFQLRNADGQGDFFDGLQPTCLAPDDLDHDIGNPLEGSLKEAFTVIATGSCSEASSQPSRARRAPGGTDRRAVGWQSIVGAH
ncbi:MAG: S41 family peptidase, partial [Vicinamibacterales bacterium]